MFHPRLSRIFNPTSFLPHALVAIAIGAVLVLTTFDHAFLLGTGPKWARPTMDLNLYYVAATYYLKDRWHLPLLSIALMNYPEGASIIYTDAIPIAAIGAKLLASVFGVSINYLGPWMVICYVLQAYFAARLSYLLGNRSLIATAAFACIATTCLMFLLRMVHTALCSQFVILWALVAYVRMQQPTPRLARVVLPPLLVTLLINPYLLLMVVPILAAAVLSGWRNPSVRQQLLPAAAIGVPLVALVLLGGGFIVPGARAGSFGDAGFGSYSWNPASMVIPPASRVWASIPMPMMRGAADGQYEGESYLGVGPLLILFAWTFFYPRDVWRLVRRHWLLLAAVMGLALFALSNDAFLGTATLWRITLPPRVAHAAALFRASGRFVWPLAYLLLLVPGVCLLRQRPRTLWIGLLMLACVIQLIEWAPFREYVWWWSRFPAPELVSRETLSPLLAQHTRVWQFPSFYCGGLGRAALGESGHSRDKQLEVVTADAGIPTNSVVMARALKDCGREREEASQLVPSAGVLYIISKDFDPAISRVQAFTQSPACRDFGWAYVCSTSFTVQTPGPTQGD